MLRLASIGLLSCSMTVAGLMSLWRHHEREITRHAEVASARILAVEAATQPCSGSRYPVHPCGVHNDDEYQQAILDPAVKAHYRNINFDEGRLSASFADSYLYSSYRKHGRIGWTSYKIRIPAGETVFLVRDHPRTYMRMVCGNLLSSQQGGAVLADEPTREEMEQGESGTPRFSPPSLVDDSTEYAVLTPASFSNISGVRTEDAAIYTTISAPSSGGSVAGGAVTGAAGTSGLGWVAAGPIFFPGIIYGGGGARVVAAPEPGSIWACTCAVAATIVFVLLKKAMGRNG